MSDENEAVDTCCCCASCGIAEIDDMIAEGIEPARKGIALHNPAHQERCGQGGREEFIAARFPSAIVGEL